MRKLVIVRGRASIAIPSLITHKDVRFSGRISWTSRNRIDDSPNASLSKTLIPLPNNEST